MGPVENEINDDIFENDENAGTAIYDFANDWEFTHISNPNTEKCILPITSLILDQKIHHWS